MPAKNRPYERSGQFILFKKLESDHLSELWRAGTIEDNRLGPIVALRRFTSGDRKALVEAATGARDIVPLLSGTSFVRDQIIDVSPDGVPYMAHEYGGGRSLRHVIDRARGGAAGAPHPLPLDQAIVIAEKVALSIDTIGNLKFHGNRLAHGSLIPQLIWISEEGEIRVAGQQLGKGIVSSLKTLAIGAELGRYFAPEYQASGQPSKSSEVYSLGAILYLVVTGQEPPDPVGASAFQQTVRTARQMGGADIPSDIRDILDKSLTLDPAARYGSPGEMKQALSALESSGHYSATTFNLAFYLSNLLKKELEGEALERDRESKVNLLAYEDSAVWTPGAAAAAVPAPTGAPSPLSAPAPRRKSGMLAVVAAIIVVGGAAAFFAFRPKASAGDPAPMVSSPKAPAPTPAQQLAAEPIVAAAVPSGVSSTATAPATTSTAMGTTTATAVDEAARKAAFEAEVKKRMQAEMLKLQSDFNKTQPIKPTAPPPSVASRVAAAPAPTPAPSSTTNAVEDHAPSASLLDQQRRDSLRQQETPTATPTESVASAAATQTVPVAAATPAPPAAVETREGDLVDIKDVDSVPQPLRPIAPQYPPVAVRQKMGGNVIVTALISETGEVVDVRVLRGAPMGMSEAAVRAVRSVQFSPAMKDGKRVKTWRPIPIIFNIAK